METDFEHYGVRERLKPGAFDGLDIEAVEEKRLAYELAHRELLTAQRNLAHNRQLLEYRRNRLLREAEEGARRASNAS
jgi:hypothetical protein